MSKITQNWGSRSQIDAMSRELTDIEGNKNGLWSDDSGLPFASLDHFVLSQPAATKLLEWARAGLSSGGERQRLSNFTARCEEMWKQPVMDPTVANQLEDGALFAAQKAIALTRMGRTPQDVSEGFIEAAGTVAGIEIAPRELFWQRFKPEGTASGKVVVIAPGFQETGRHFYEQIVLLNQAGHDVIVMDQQWAGHSEGEKGGIDRGFGVARDVAAMAAHAQLVLQAEYGGQKNRQVVLLGNSMGAGPGVLGALTLNDHDLIKLEGSPMPKGLNAVLQAPYLQATKNLTNGTLALASKLPILNKIAAPSVGLPVLTKNPVAAQKTAQFAVLEDVRAQLEALNAANADLAFITAAISAGRGPTGHITIVHGRNDVLADPERSRWLKERLGSGADLQLLDTSDHVLEHHPELKHVAVAAVSDIGSPAKR